MNFMELLIDVIALMGNFPPEVLVALITLACLAVVYQALRVIGRALDRRND